MRTLRWWSLLLVPGGFVAGHELGYQGAAALGAAPRAAGGHGYLGLVLLVGAPFAFAAVARAFLAGLRHQLPPVRLRTLAAAQVALFLAVELAEHAAAGLGPAGTLTSRPVLLGLAAQPVVAGLLYLVVRTTGAAGAAVAEVRGRRPVTVARPPWRPVDRTAVAPAVPRSSTSSRGPPTGTRALAPAIA